MLHQIKFKKIFTMCHYKREQKKQKKQKNKKNQQKTKKTKTKTE